jgi:hypothetical protein
MGTRNLTKVINKAGEVVVAQYGQWDGYPSGQGLTALYHAHNAKKIEKGLSRVRFATDEEIETMNSTIDFNNEEFSIRYPNVSRDTCADILGVVAYSVGEVLLVDSKEFETDELFCEGVYTIDFQQNKFISWYGGKTVEFELDYLPDRATYLMAWE